MTFNHRCRLVYPELLSQPSPRTLGVYFLSIQKTTHPCTDINAHLYTRSQTQKQLCPRAAGVVIWVDKAAFDAFSD